MNKDLAEVIKLYAMGSHKDLNAYLLDKSKDTLIALLTDLVTMYINDKNSSTLKEFVTVAIAGYEHHETKIGYNGYRQSSLSGERSAVCEAKPKNVRTDGLSKRKLDGGGNFTDYTFARLEKDLTENPNMLPSGFVDGKLIYVLEFPFCCETFVERLREQVQRRFPNGGVTGQFLRSATFDFRHYEHCDSLKVVFVLSRRELERYEENFTKGFYQFIWSRAQ